MGPIIGTLVDRWNRKKIMLLSDSIIALATLLLAYIFYIDKVQIWMVYLIMFIRAIGGGFHTPAMMATMPLMVPDKYLSNIHGIRAVIFGGLQIISAPLAAFLLGLMSTIGVLLIDVFTALFAIIPLIFIAVPQPNKSQGIAGLGFIKSVRSDMVAGFKYVWNWVGLSLFLGLFSFLMVLLGPAWILLPLLVTNHFGRDVLDLAWILSANGIGAVLGGITLSLWGGFKKRILTVLTSVIVSGLCYILLSALPPSLFTIAIIALFLGGFTAPFGDGPFSAILQSCTAPELQGRVWTISNTIFGAATPLGLLIAGPVTDILGIRFWYIAGGIGSVIIGITFMLIPAVMNIEKGCAKAA